MTPTPAGAGTAQDFPSRLSHEPVRLSADPGVVVGYPAERGGGTPLSLGADARLRGGTFVYTGCTIGDRFQTGHHVVVREDSTIGHDVSVWSSSVVDYACVIGDGVKIHTGCYVAQLSRLEDGCFLAPGVVLANDLYPGDHGSADVMAGPTIGAGAQVGVGSRVLPYVSIGAGAIIGSGSVVTKDVPEGAVAYGVPATVRGRVADLVPIEDRVARDASGRPGLVRSPS